jgi:rare lipoprotein A
MASVCASGDAAKAQPPPRKKGTFSGVVRSAFCLAAMLGLAACSSGIDKNATFGMANPGVTAPRLVAYGTAVPKGGGRQMVGEPYRIAGKTYVPQEDPQYSKVGIASWYGYDFHGRKTANGEIYDLDAVTAAHPTLPLPSYVRVTNLENGRSITVRVNDRGPFVDDRLIDVSRKVARLLDFESDGTTKVRVDYVGPATLDANDEKTLLASYRDGRGSAAPIAAASVVAGSPPEPALRPSTAVAGEVPIPAQRPGLPSLTGPGVSVVARAGLSYAAPQPRSVGQVAADKATELAVGSSVAR